MAGYHAMLGVAGLLSNSPVSIQSGVLLMGGTVSQNVTMSGGGIDDLVYGQPSTISGSLMVNVLSGGTATWYSGFATVVGGATVQNGLFRIGGGAELTTPTLTVSGGALNLVTGGTLNGSLNYTSSNSSTLAGQITGGSSTLTLNNSSATLRLPAPTPTAAGRRSPPVTYKWAAPSPWGPRPPP